jgi:hypothetical protein
MSISKFLINKKVVKNEQQANGLMIVVIIACLLFIIFQNTESSSDQISEFTDEELESLQQEGLDPNDPLFANPDEI